VASSRIRLHSAARSEQHHDHSRRPSATTSCRWVTTYFTGNVRFGGHLRLTMLIHSREEYARRRVSAIPIWRNSLGQKAGVLAPVPHRSGGLFAQQVTACGLKGRRSRLTSPEQGELISGSAPGPWTLGAPGSAVRARSRRGRRRETGKNGRRQTWKDLLKYNTGSRELLQLGGDRHTRSACQEAAEVQEKVKKIIKEQTCP